MSTLTVSAGSSRAFSRELNLYRSIRDHLTGGKPEIKGDLCVFRFNEGTSLCDDNVDSINLKNELWNLTTTSNEVIFDLSKVTFLGEDASGALFALGKNLKNSGVKLGLISLKSEVLENLEIKHFDKHFLISNTEEEMIEKFKGESLGTGQKRDLRELARLEGVGRVRTLLFEEKQTLAEIATVSTKAGVVTISFKPDSCLDSDRIVGLDTLGETLLRFVKPHKDNSSLVLDFGNVTYIDKPAICSLVKLHKQHPKVLTISGISNEPLNKLQEMHLDQFFTILTA
jgi:anti-anti-sigma regulatory factor